MNDAEATRLLELELRTYRDQPYATLIQRIGAGLVVCMRRGAGSARYQLEIDFVWDDRPGGNVRVIGSIDDGGWRSFVPLTQSFVKVPDQPLVDE